MKESKFVKTKIFAGYAILIAVCVLSVGYVYRTVVRFSTPRRQLFPAPYQTQRRGTDALPSLSGRELRSADDRRIPVLRVPLQTRAAHRARPDRLAAGADRCGGFAADDASGQHRASSGRQGAADDEPAADDPFGRHVQPAGQEYPRADRSGGQRGARGTASSYGRRTPSLRAWSCRIR